MINTEGFYEKTSNGFASEGNTSGRSSVELFACSEAVTKLRDSKYVTVLECHTQTTANETVLLTTKKHGDKTYS